MNIELLAADLASRIPAMAGDSVTNNADVIKRLLQQLESGIKPEPPVMSKEEVWMRAWTATAGGSNTVYSNTARDWADQCVADFDRRFRK